MLLESEKVWNAGGASTGSSNDRVPETREPGIPCKVISSPFTVKEPEPLQIQSSTPIPASDILQSKVPVLAGKSAVIVQ